MFFILHPVLFLLLCRTPLLEDLPNAENFNRPLCFPPESQHSIMPENNQMKDLILDSQSISSNLFSMGSSKYLKTHAFSPSVGWDGEEVTPSYPDPCNLEQKHWPPVKVRFSICFSSGKVYIWYRARDLQIGMKCMLVKSQNDQMDWSQVVRKIIRFGREPVFIESVMLRCICMFFLGNKSF